MVDDLNTTGYFKIIRKSDPCRFSTDIADIVADSAGSGADYVVFGSISEKGYNDILLSIKIFDRNKGEIVLSRIYTSKKEYYRWVAHRICDQFFQVITGKYGPFEDRLLFSKSNNEYREIYISDYDGYGEKKLTKWKTINILPKWINNSSFFFTSYRARKPASYLYDLLTGKIKLFFNHKGLSITPIPFKNSLYAISLSFSDNIDIYLVNKNSKIIKRLTFDKNIDVSPTFSPDRSKMAFVSKRHGSPQIFIKNLNTERIKRLTFDGSYNTSPSWSPTSDYIAYVSVHKTISKLCIIKPDGSQMKELVEAESIDCPSWSQDGRFIAYISQKKDRSYISIVCITTGHKRVVLETNGLYNGLDWLSLKKK
jgi:TolB protein